MPSVTWHASISPALHCSASPVFADADPETFCIDAADVRRKLTDRTCAIVATRSTATRPTWTRYWTSWPAPTLR